MTTRAIVILKTGDTFEALKRRRGDFEDWIGDALGSGADRATVHDARHGRLPDLGPGDAVIVTGSPEMVTEHAPWMEDAATWLRGLVEKQTPVLGICFGHQLLAHALGGTVGWHPGGRELGTVEITATAEASRDPLLGTLPASFPAHTSHSQTVVTLPPAATLLAYSDLEPHHAYRVGPCAWGVQFHPEFSEAIQRAYVERYRDRLAEAGQDPDRVVAAVRPSPGGRLLSRFADYAAARAEER